MLITRPEDYESPKKTPGKEPKMSPLYTTFRMNDQPDEKKRENGSLHKKRINKRRKQKRREPGSYAESEYDSGVDVSSKYVPHHKKKEATTPVALPPTQQQALPWEQDLLDLTLDVTRPMAQLQLDNSSSTDILSYLPDESNPAWMPWFTSAPPMFNNAVLDHTHWNVDNATWDDTALLQQLQSADDFFTPTPSTSYPTLLASRYDPADEVKESMEAPPCSYAADMAKIEESLKELMAYQQQEQQQAVSQAIEMAKANPPVVVNLDDEEVTQQFLHFEDDAGDADDEDDEDDDKQQHLTGGSSEKIDLIYPGSVDDTPTSILQHHHEFVSMSELLYASRL
ncbi:hypothetical protein BJV82DRAFT_257231 [Fennellomyces sp. T-0311]|nr:hypothetical protein BJV82DRAFT_257231 [Fennellomyces sp. T-0311]